jgi:hypothetical protein
VASARNQHHRSFAGVSSHHPPGARCDKRRCIEYEDRDGEYLHTAHVRESHHQRECRSGRTQVREREMI